MATRERATIHVDGVVQSVGFRPFVYRTAVDLNLAGTVRNLGDAGVRIELDGLTADIDTFLARLRENPPPLARVESVEIEREPTAEPTFEQFEILDSEENDRVAGNGDSASTIPPDTAMCDNCLADMRDPDSRYNGYWATACVDCGPRFTVVEGLPYDRPTTSMAAFPMCDDCRGEYEAPADRRYHAQAIACPQCGPTLRYGTVSAPLPEESGASSETGRDEFPDSFSTVNEGTAAVLTAARTIRNGGIAVVKGVGGAHLACKATDSSAVERLRERTGRETKPFALMVPGIEVAQQLAYVSETEREELTSPQRPIVLVEERDDAAVASGVAPGLHTLGVMLPYSGVHHLLFDQLSVPLVLTSANRPGRPMLVGNDAIVSGLADVADGFLLHDRRIVARCDDSVARVVDGRRRLIRRSRGFAPTPVALPAERRVLALGPEFDVTPGVLADGGCYLTQYVGDVDTLATFDYLREAVDHLLDITGLDRPSVVTHDAHPEFNTTDHAQELEDAGLERVAVQHHHAHAASVLAEHDREAAIAITIDGVGYGADGTIWGGEVLDATRKGYERVAGLAPMAMPGGDRATRFPGRMLAGGLFSASAYDAERVRETLEAHDVPFPSTMERELVCQQLAQGVNTVTTTSAGRFLDAVSGLLGLCAERTYEGEPAMRLEAVAAGGEARKVEGHRSTIDGRPVLDTPALLARLVDLFAEGAPPADVAATAQETLARGLAELALDAADSRTRDTVALSGGVAYNEHIAARVRERVEAAGLTFLGNEDVPPGDGGVAYGQAAVAAARTDS